MRVLTGGPGYLAEDPVVDAARIAAPPLGLRAGQGVEDLDSICRALELLAVDDVLPRARGVEEPDRRRAGRGADHRHQRHDARTAADQEQRPPVVLPDEVAADRPAHLELVAFTRLVDEVRRDLAVLETLDRDRERLAGRRRDRVAAFGLVAILSRQPYVEVLSRPVSRPAVGLELQRPDTRRLRGRRRHRRDEPGEPAEDRGGHRTDPTAGTALSFAAIGANVEATSKPHDESQHCRPCLRRRGRGAGSPRRRIDAGLGKDGPIPLRPGHEDRLGAGRIGRAAGGAGLAPRPRAR